MKRDLLPLVTVDGRYAGELLAHPCACGRPRCTLGEHIWESTRNMAPGPRAANTDPRGRSWPSDVDRPDPVDSTGTLHPQYKALLDQFHGAARNLVRFIDAHRPDRWVKLPDPLTDEEWCRLHLNAGYCEPRYRGDLCRWCYELGQAHNAAPDDVLIRAKAQGQRITNVLIGDWLARVKVIRKTKRRRAS